jgi:phosphate acetyltransferase
MSYLETLKERFKKESKSIVLPEISDERVRDAATRLAEENICDVFLINDNPEADYKANFEGVERITVIDTFADKRAEEFAELFFEKRKHKGITIDEAKSVTRTSLYFASFMVETGLADACVAGAATSTADVLRSAIYCIGLKPDSSVVSSIFLMSNEEGRTMAFGDCAVVPYPDSKQLASIASDSADSFEKIIGVKPNVAMLSFSTQGSAKHERVELVTEALESVKKNRHNLSVDGEMQFDTAFVPGVAQRKAPESDVAGKANVFVFPNLDAGNIGYKIAERLGGYNATGPIIQGLNKPMNDLSRGCSADDIVNTVLVSLSMS